MVRDMLFLAEKTECCLTEVRCGRGKNVPKKIETQELNPVLSDRRSDNLTWQVGRSALTLFQFGVCEVMCGREVISRCEEAGSTLVLGRRGTK